MSAVQASHMVGKQGTTTLTEIESKELLKGAGIPVVEAFLARTKKEAVSLGQQIGFPVVMKIASPDITHKTDLGGVRLDIKNKTQLEKAFSEVVSSIKRKQPRARIQGVSIQKMARPGTEIIVGMTKDPQFGPVLMFGLGGILVELLGDVSFRIVPITLRDAQEMIEEIKGYRLLTGYRGQEPVDIAFLGKLLVKVSGFIEAHPEINELDLNPVLAYEDGAVVVDARIVL